MCGAIPLLPQFAFMAWCLVKHRGNFPLIEDKNIPKTTQIKFVKHVNFRFRIPKFTLMKEYIWHFKRWLFQKYGRMVIIL